MHPSFSSQNTFISLDKALEFVGDNSQFQKKTIYLFAVQWSLFCFLLMGMPFLLSSPEFLCRSSTGSFHSCDEVSACSAHPPILIDPEHSPSSISLDFELYCDRKYYVGLCGFTFFLGSLIGGFVFPNLAERRGRRRVLLISGVLPGITLIFMGFMNQIGIVLICFLIIGMAFNGFETASLIYINEISGERFRHFAAMTMTVVWAFGQIIYAGLTYFIDDWRVITIVLIGCPFMILSFLANRQLLETPKFLINMGRYIEAHLVLNQIAQINKRPQFTYRLEGEIEEIQLMARNYSEPKPIERDYIRIQSENYGYIDLFRYRSLRYLTVSLLFLWFFKNFTYFGLAFSLPGFGGEVHENFLLTAVAELVGCFLSGPFKEKLTRIRALMTLVGSITVLCLAMGFFRIPSSCFSQTRSCYQKGLTVFIAMAARFCITVYSSVLMSYTGEVYPTVVKNLGFGICIAFGKLGALITPIVVVSLQMEGLSSLVLFGSFGLIVAILITRLQETDGKNIGDYIEETQSDQKALLTFKDEDDKNLPLLT